MLAGLTKSSGWREFGRGATLFGGAVGPQCDRSIPSKSETLKYLLRSIEAARHDIGCSEIEEQAIPEVSNKLLRYDRAFLVGGSWSESEAAMTTLPLPLPLVLPADSPPGGLWRMLSGLTAPAPL